ncbi:TolC family outer membrane protein [Paludibacterium sp.]|uniref:TolC family outer membrane protein n=2 Tax=Paludibacterium sp. TaxID=1917523 RepID=UPI0025E44C2C|nr:TolC family outer membrane protein [Paludibacterium sp.]
MRKIACSLACCFAVIGMSTPVAAFDLLLAWRAARLHDAGYAAAQSDYRAGREQAPLGRAPLMPQISLIGNYQQSHTINQPLADGLLHDADGATRGMAVQLTQSLFDPGKWAGFRKGQASQARAAILLDIASQQLMVDVAAAYFNVLQAQDNLTATQMALKAYANRRAQAEKEFEIGQATIADAMEAQAGYDSAVADEIQAQSDLEIHRSALARLTGLPAQSPQPLAAPFPLALPSPARQEDWQTLAEHNNLAIRAQALALFMTEQSLKERRAGRLPTVQLIADYKDNTTQAPTGAIRQQSRARIGSVAIAFNMPLSTGGSLRAQVREAAAHRDSARDKLLDTRRHVREEIRRAWLGITDGAASVRAQAQRLVSAQRKLDATERGREVGIRTNLDLLKAQQEYSDVFKALAGARYRFLNARLKLAQSAGQLDETVLAQVNRAIQP